MHDFRFVVHRSELHQHPEGRGTLDLAVQRWGESGVRVEDGGDPRDPGRGLFEQLEPFSDNRRVPGAETRDIAARPSKARHQASPDRIGDDYENDWYRARLLLQRRE